VRAFAAILARIGRLAIPLAVCRCGEEAGWAEVRRGFWQERRGMHGFLAENCARTKSVAGASGTTMAYETRFSAGKSAWSTGVLRSSWLKWRNYLLERFRVTPNGKYGIK